MFNSQDKPKGAKKSVDTEKGLERRQQQSISIRRNKRDELLEKKRRMNAGDEDPSAAVPLSTTDPMAFNSETNPSLIPVALLPQFAEMARSQQQEYAFHGTLMIRKLLSIESNPPIDAVVESGVVPLFVHYMTLADYPKLQFEAAWALTNIASGTAEHTHLVIEAGAVPHFISLLSSPSEDCREQATWAIGNLAGEGQKCRDYCLELGAMPPLLTLISTPGSKITVLRNAVWALSNLCRGKPQPKLELVGIALPVLSSLINHHDDEVVVDATWALSYISDGPGERVQAVLDIGVLNRVVQLLSAPTAAMQTPAIRIIGNIATGSDRQTQMIINSGALQAMHFLLQHTKRAIRKETCWTLSNICAGHRDQVQATINANLFPVVLQCVGAPELEVKKEALWVIANTASGGSKEQIRYLVSINTISVLCDVLTAFDPKVLTVALEALTNILECGEEDKASNGTGRNLFADMVSECGGVSLIENLQTHTNNEVYHNAITVLESFFESSVVENGAAPAANGFAFQQPSDVGTGGFSF